MIQKDHPATLSRRDVLIAAAATAAAVATPKLPARARTASSFDIERFIDDCRRANDGAADGQSAVAEVLARVISDPDAVLAGVGEPQKGGIRMLLRSKSLTILNIVWAPLMQLVPHEHNMWSLIGIYTGREDNIFWERRGRELAAVGAAAISPGRVTPLPRDVIHSVANPTEKLTGAIHIYGGDFFGVARSEWDPETFTEREWSIRRAEKIFEDSNQRFFSWQGGRCA
jgi:predicted metal-dependent enzyme (double-stranded beta helix superfamily)